MNWFLHRLATPLTFGLFAVSAVSGVALFFRWAPGTFHQMHVWLSMVLLLPFAFHVCKNWRHLLGYARLGTLLWPLVACLLIAIPFAVSLSHGRGRPGGPPSSRAAQLMTQTPLTDLAPVLRTTPDALVATLRQHGYGTATAADTLETIATASHAQATDLLSTLLPH